MKEFILQPVADFGEYLNGRKITTIGVGPDGEALVLAVTSGLADERFAPYTQPGWITLKRDNNAVTPMLLEFRPDYIGEISLAQMEAKQLSNIQPLPNGEILLVDGRCNYQSGNPEKNAVVYGPEGLPRRCFIMGDGIQDIQVTSKGTIWASYFDEGVFGNYGWNEPLGASGLVHFDANGEILWSFEARSGFDYIADCYAMNVADNATWVCYYDSFPIVRIKPDGTMRGWQNEFGGAYALTTDNHRVLLFGGYGGQRNRCVVQEFGDEKMVRAREINLVLPDGEIPERVRAVGRGSTLHLFIGTVWYQFDLAEVDA